jgi:hypothetical protein
MIDSWARTVFRVAMRLRTLTHIPLATDVKHRGTVHQDGKDRRDGAETGSCHGSQHKGCLVERGGNTESAGQPRTRRQVIEHGAQIAVGRAVDQSSSGRKDDEPAERSFVGCEQADRHQGQGANGHQQLQGGGQRQVPGEPGYRDGAAHLGKRHGEDHGRAATGVAREAQGDQRERDRACSLRDAQSGRRDGPAKHRPSPSGSLPQNCVAFQSPGTFTLSATPVYGSSRSRAEVHTALASSADKP